MTQNSINKKDVRGFYDEVYKNGDIRDNLVFYKWVVDLIDLKPSSKLLDIGCGVGCLLREANKRQADSFGLDISFHALIKAGKALQEARLSVGDGEALPFKENSFDVIVSLGSIEHFFNQEKALKEIFRILKDKGQAILILPNSFYLEDIFKVLVKGKTDEQWQIQERLMTKEGWKGLIESSGLKVEKIYGRNKFPELFAEGTFKLKSVRKFVKRLLIKYFCPVNLSWEFLFLCKK